MRVIEASMKESKTQFRARTWIFRAQLLLFGFFCAIGLTMGPLFIAGMKDAQGRPAPEAGFWLTTITAGVFLPAFARALFDLRARKRPLVSLWREGIQVRLIGRTSLDGVPGVPNLIRFAWGVLSTQSFRSRTRLALWEEIQGAWVEGLPAMRILIIEGEFWSTNDVCDVEPRILFHQVDFRDSLPEIADAIQSCSADPNQLSSWSEAN